MQLEQRKVTGASPFGGVCLFSMPTSSPTLCTSVFQKKLLENKQENNFF